MDSKKTARIAGLFYLVVVLTGIFNLAYVPSRLITWDDPAATFSSIMQQEMLFRLGILAGIICFIAFLILPFILYKLLHSINKSYATAMIMFAVVSVPISLINLLNKFSVLTLISKADYLKVFETNELHTQVMLYLDYYANGIQIASIFWGLWLFPLGYLVFKSDFLPKALGILLMAGCFGYLINFTGRFLYPGYSELGISGFISMPGSIGEIGICLWLLIRGVKQKYTIE